MSLPSLGKWRAVIGWALSLVLLSLVARELWAQWGALRAQDLTFSVGWGAVAALGLAVFMVLSSEAWRRLILGLGFRLSGRQAFYVLFIANLGKYIPGGVWSIVGRAGLAQMMGVSAAATFLSVLVETALQLTAAAIVVLLSLPAYTDHPLLAQPLVLVAPIGAAMLLIHPRVLNVGLSVVRRVSKRDVPRLEFTYGFVVRLLGRYVFNWLLLGASFAALGRALMPTGLSGRETMILIGGFALAWNTGVFAFFLPGGVGVREAALVMVLGRSFPAGWPAALAIAARVWMTLGELACFGIGVLLGGPAPTAEPREKPAAEG
jgi:glycosyltransferase 2 family protein